MIAAPKAIRQHKRTLSRLWLLHRGVMKMKYHLRIADVYIDTKITFQGDMVRQGPEEYIL